MAKYAIATLAALVAATMALAKWEDRDAALSQASFSYRIERAIDDGTGVRNTVENGTLAYSAPDRYKWRQEMAEGGKPQSNKETMRQGKLRLEFDNVNSVIVVSEREAPNERSSDPWVNLGPRACLPIAGSLSRAVSWTEIPSGWQAESKDGSSALTLIMDKDGLPGSLTRRFRGGQEVSWTFTGRLRDGAVAIPANTRSISGGTALLKIDAKYSFSKFIMDPKLVDLDAANWWDSGMDLVDERVSPEVTYPAGELERLYKAGKVVTLDQLLAESRKRSERLLGGQKMGEARQQAMQQKQQTSYYPYLATGMAVFGVGLVVLSKRLRTKLP